jgi:hypothetical protein
LFVVYGQDKEVKMFISKAPVCSVEGKTQGMFRQKAENEVSCLSSPGYGQKSALKFVGIGVK